MMHDKILSKRALKERLSRTDPGDARLSKTAGRAAMPGKPVAAWRTVKRLLAYMGPYKIAVFLVFLTLITATLSAMFIPIIFSIALDEYILTFDFEGVYLLAVLILGIAVFNSVVRFFSRFLMVRITQKVVKRLRKDGFSALLRAPVSYYDEKGAGDIVSRLSNDVELISNALSQTILEVLNSSIVLLGALVLMFYLNWALALIVIAFLPLMVVFTIAISKRTRRGFKAQQKHLAALNGIVEENISGLRTVKLYNQEQPFIDEFSEDNDRLKRAGFKAQFYAGIVWPFIHFMNNFIFLTVIGAGAALHLLLGPAFLTIGQIAGVSQYSRRFIMPISNLAQLFNALMQGVAGAERVFELIDATSEYADDGAQTLGSVEGDVAFENVDFSYVEGVRVLKDITFRAEQGDLIAIAGPTGGGKTTAIKLLNRFYEVESGRITIDGVDIRNIQKDALRRRIGIVLQDTHLFKGTVYENIRYGDASASREEILRAAKDANAHEFISKLPDGYESIIHEGGQNLSQGERQLISIARTFLTDPDLLILDEATSNVDTRTEAKIQSSTHRLMQGRTSIVIAHRLQTIRRADIILVINEGRLVETGTHETLLKKKGFYSDLYHAQYS